MCEALLIQKCSILLSGLLFWRNMKKLQHSLQIISIVQSISMWRNSDVMKVREHIPRWIWLSQKLGYFAYNNQIKIGCKYFRSTNVKLQLFLVLKNTGITTEWNVFQGAEHVDSDDSHKNAQGLEKTTYGVTVEKVKEIKIDRVTMSNHIRCSLT